MCVQVPCVYIPHTASSVTARNNVYGNHHERAGLKSSEQITIMYLVKPVKRHNSLRGKFMIYIHFLNLQSFYILFYTHHDTSCSEVTGQDNEKPLQY